MGQNENDAAKKILELVANDFIKLSNTPKTSENLKVIIQKTVGFYAAAVEKIYKDYYVIPKTELKKYIQQNGK